MHVDLTKELFSPDDKPIHISETDDTPVTLKFAVMEALLNSQAGDEGDGKALLHRYGLVLKIKESPALVELEPADVGLIQERLLKQFPTWVAGQAYHLMDPKGEAEAPRPGPGARAPRNPRIK